MSFTVKETGRYVFFFAYRGKLMFKVLGRKKILGSSTNGDTKAGSNLLSLTADGDEGAAGKPGLCGRLRS